MPVPTAISGTAGSRRSTRAPRARSAPRAGQGCSGRRLSDRGECTGSGLMDHLARAVAHPRRRREVNVPSSGRGAWLESGSHRESRSSSSWPILNIGDDMGASLQCSANAATAERQSVHPSGKAPSAAFPGSEDRAESADVRRVARNLREPQARPRREMPSCAGPNAQTVASVLRSAFIVPTFVSGA